MAVPVLRALLLRLHTVESKKTFSLVRDYHSVLASERTHYFNGAVCCSVSQDAHFHSICGGYWLSTTTTPFRATTVQRSAPAWTVMSPSSPGGHLHLVRFKKRNRGDTSRHEQDLEDDDGDDDEDEGSGSDEDIDAFGQHFDEDNELPDNYRETRSYIKSTRLDSVISTALNISKKKVEDQVLGSHVYLNGQRANKKSEKVEVGDFIDIITRYEDDGRMKVKRVRMVDISSTRSKKGKAAIYLRTWKDGVVIDNYTKKFGA